MTLAELVAQKLEALPARPGCYLFRGKDGELLYVGKATSLRNRVRSYFQPGTSDERYFIPLLPRLVLDLDTVVVDSAKEAAILENSLIKEHQPRFNVKLRDDKEFLSLRLDTSKDFPRLEVVRKPKNDRARYFGPYPSATSARRTLHVTNKHFQLRTCTDTDFKARKRACLQYQIKRCPAPCVYDIDRDHYDGQVKAVSLFLAGRHDELTRQLQMRMQASAKEMDYELAAVYRDQLRAVAAVRERQRLVAGKHVNQDIIGFYREGELVEVVVLYVRNGRVSDTAFYSHKRIEVPDDELVGQLLLQFYADKDAARLPAEIVLPLLPEGVEGVAEWLSERREKAVAIVNPKRGPKRKLLDLATENASHSFREKQRAKDDIDERLQRIKAKLRLPHIPEKIECIDISHLGGDDTVGAIVAMRRGQLAKKDYKIFHVKEVSGGDDYGAMSEVLRRRFRRALAAEDEGAEGEEAWRLPDLLVVDGGRGQLNIALTAAKDLGLHHLPIVGLAKERENRAGDTLSDRVYLPGQKNGIALGPQQAALYLLAQLRDEAHRFSNYHREKLGKGRRMETGLSGIKGVGPQSRKALFGAFDSVDAMRAASDDELREKAGVNRRVVAALRAHWTLAATAAGA